MENTNKRIKAMSKGCNLLVIFLCLLVIGITMGILALIFWVPNPISVKYFIIICVAFALVESIIFWDGIIRVYVTSVQLGIKWRVVGILCGWIPIANIIALVKIIRTVRKEVSFEKDKLELENARKENEICSTKYPVLLVHGVFFRDYKFLNYWGRIPASLIRNGANIFYGKQQSAATVPECGSEIAKRIEEILEETGAEKVNIIGHSKGGLDSRYAISCCGMADKVASLTTINTPHRGCIFAEYLFNMIPESVRKKIAAVYNTSLSKFGDHDPDFLGAVLDLTNSRCKELNQEMVDAEGVYYQSVGTKLKKATGGKFPLNMTHGLVKYFDGPNDGLVSVDSAKWGEKFIYVEAPGKRGISHGDVIDLNRENIEGFDVREFYVNILKDLKEKGM